MHKFRNTKNNNKSGKMLAGMLLLIIGSLLLMRSLNLLFLPYWLFSWPVLLITIGLLTGIRKSFRSPGPFILILIGSIFLAKNILHGDFDRFIWPALIIGAGLWMILGRSCRRPALHKFADWDKRTNNPDSEPFIEPQTEPRTSSFAEDRIDTVSIFGGIKKNILSKNFMGGEIMTFFGGVEINLMQADIQGRIELDVTQVFGGTKLILPPNWTVHSEMVAIFGGIEDKRPPQTAISSDNKVLVIIGTSIFGGIDIRSF